MALYDQRNLFMALQVQDKCSAKTIDSDLVHILKHVYCTVVQVL